MSEQAPPNWYPDPSGRFSLRYWNGTQWTEHVSTGGTTTTDMPGGPPAVHQPQQPQQWPAYQYGYGQAAAVQRTNGMAVASLVLGILWLYWIGSILAVIFGFIGRNQIKRSNGAEKGTGLATAGLILGWLGVASLLVVIVVAIVIAASDNNSF